MENLSRRNMLKAGGTVGAVGALATVSQATPWTWSPAGSVPGRGSGANPQGVWDDEADPVVAKLLERGQVQRVNELLRGWTKNGQPLPAGLPNELRDFMEHARQLPSWTDRGKLETAVRFNQKRGTYLGVLYGFASGMMSTVIPREARAVYYSQGGADMKDRITKTAKLGYDIGSLNAYRPDGEMIVTCLKTRLAHASVRTLLPQSPWWNHSAQEKIPISQADIMVTWHSLPTTVMRMLERWNVPIAADESDGFLHSWQITAHMLGVQDQYIPNSWNQADAQARQVLDPILAPTPEGKKLADILLDLGMNLDLSLLSRGVLGALTRFMLGDKIANWLEIPREPVWSPLLETAWGPYVLVREGLLQVGMPKEAYWLFDEFLRQFVLFYMSELRMPINITIPVANNPRYN
ncbi:oxygenase MpaB family protein [Gordonia sp. Z-3]|uniref:Oxygenase MpaB family protein n=1 Tax=Gordonia tangerina TaxID=2911060 RepID=A0ABS9DI71_9ACTN|nr:MULTISPECIES: oxygenase MpaB family protein [Gordonia]MCF3938287.1 oxygenase MpaB family protein [Gordonia tangerina]MED5803309.1 oxygenase MpaB family protein [Gordonia sp. Z-3]